MESLVKVKLEIGMLGDDSIWFVSKKVIMASFRVVLHVNDSKVIVPDLNTFLIMLKGLGLYESFVTESVEFVKSLQEKVYDCAWFDDLPYVVDMEDDDTKEELIDIGNLTTTSTVGFLLQIPSQDGVMNMVDIWESYIRNLSSNIRVKLFK